MRTPVPSLALQLRTWRAPTSGAHSNPVVSLVDGALAEVVATAGLVLLIVALPRPGRAAHAPSAVAHPEKERSP